MVTILCNVGSDNVMRDKNTKVKLLASAKKEFLSVGYDKASLRRICKNIGVSTGALYFFFDDKAALFDALVGKTAKHLIELLNVQITREKPSGSFRDTQYVESQIAFGKMIVSYYYLDQDSMNLLFHCADGSPYEHFKDNIISILEEQNRENIYRRFEKTSKIFNDSTIHWLAHIQTEAILHILSHNVTEERALRQVEIVINYLIAGFDRISELAVQEEQG